MPALELYAPDKGRYSRWIIGVSTMLLVGYGAYSLYYALPDGLRQPLVKGWMPLGSEYPISWSLVLGLVVLLAGAGGTWWMINYVRLVNFLHEVEVEMGKVSWASRSEVVSSSIVVVVATIVLAGWVYLADLVLIGVRRLLGG